MGQGRSGRVRGLDIELREEMEGEGDGTREWGTLLAFWTATASVGVVSVGDAGTNRDLVLSMYLSALFRPACY